MENYKIYDTRPLEEGLASDDVFVFNIEYLTDRLREKEQYWTDFVAEQQRKVQLLIDNDIEIPASLKGYIPNARTPSPEQITNCEVENQLLREKSSLMKLNLFAKMEKMTENGTREVIAQRQEDHTHDMGGYYLQILRKLFKRDDVFYFLEKKWGWDENHFEIDNRKENQTLKIFSPDLDEIIVIVDPSFEPNIVPVNISKFKYGYFQHTPIEHLDRKYQADELGILIRNLLEESAPSASRYSSIYQKTEHFSIDDRDMVIGADFSMTDSSMIGYWFDDINHKRSSNYLDLSTGDIGWDEFEYDKHWETKFGAMLMHFAHAAEQIPGKNKT